MSKTKNVVIDDQNKKNENKQAIIKRLTDLMDTICGYYWKGRLVGCRPWVHERDEDGDAISIDLYNFGGDGKAVCDGLKPCTLTYDDNSQESGHLFCMCYNPDPDEVTPLIFLFAPEDDEDCTMDIDPEDVSEETLQNILTWLEAEWASNSHEHKPSPKELTSMMDRWAGFCFNHPPYEDVILWMVGGSKQHYLYQHFCSKWLHLCENVCHEDTMATWIRFYRELDNKWAERLMEYVYCEWKKKQVTTKTTVVTEQEIIMLGVAIDSHTKMLLNEEEAYKRNGNTEAVKECLDEVRRFKALKEKLENYGKDN